MSKKKESESLGSQSSNKKQTLVQKKKAQTAEGWRRTMKKMRDAKKGKGRQKA
jgi:hypothetical protein